MKTILMWAAAASVITAASASAQSAAPAQRPTPPAARADAPPPPPGADRDHGGGERGHGMRGHGRRGDGGPGGGMRGPRLTPEEHAKRRADLFARMDANKNGQVTFEEYRGFVEAERLARQKRQFDRLSGGQPSVTLDQLNARALQRERDVEKRIDGRRGDHGRGPGGR